MHPKLRWPAVISGLLFFVSSAAAQLVFPLPTPPPTPTVAPQPPAVNPEQNIPVVITYGQGVETRVQITHGIMQPVGIPPNQPVTVTLFLSSQIPGTLVQVGLYDGGQIAPAVTSSNLPDGGGNSVSLPAAAPIFILADQTVRFNFQSGAVLGLYRALVTVGTKQYLLQLYAVRPRSVSPLPGISPPPGPSPPNTPPPR